MEISELTPGMKKGVAKDVAGLSRRRRQVLRDLGLGEELTSVELLEKLRRRDAENKSLNRQVKRLSEKVKTMGDEIKAKDGTISELEAKVRELEARLASKEASPKVKKTSANSSLPPSKEIVPAKRTKSLRVKSDNKPGGQPGHPGSTRMMEGEDAVTETRRVEPPHICPKCGKPLDMSRAVVGAVHQIIDIPMPIVADIINYCRIDVKCDCGHCCKGEFPKEAAAPVSFGPGIMAFIGYLSIYQNVPFKRLVDLLEALFGLHVSEGTVSNILKKMRKYCRLPYEKIREKVAQARAKGADETGVRHNGTNLWMWVFQSAVATYLTVDEHRSHDVINKHFTKEEQKKGILTTDRLGAYFVEDLGISDHQICLAHLLREAVYLSEAYPNDTWGLDLIDLLHKSIDYKYDWDVGEKERERRRKEMEAELDELLARPPVYTEKDGKKTEIDKLKSSLMKYRDYMFNFLTHADVGPTNNDSERALRPAKTKLKVSGCFRSKEGAETYATIASVIQTTIKNKQNPYVVLKTVAESALE